MGRPIPTVSLSPATAAFPILVQGRRPHWTFRGLLNVHSRYGLSARRVAKRPVCLEGSDGFVTSTAAPIATGWSDPVAGWELHPLKTNTFPRRTLVIVPMDKIITPDRPLVYVPIACFVVVLMLAWPQVAFALLGGFLSRRYKVTIARR